MEVTSHASAHLVTLRHLGTSKSAQIAVREEETYPSAARVKWTLIEHDTEDDMQPMVKKYGIEERAPAGLSKKHSDWLDTVFTSARGESIWLLIPSST